MANGEKNKHGLSRNIPDPIQRVVRQRSGFGCVVCGKGIYQYEHFNPEFKDASEHRAEGITLLCGQCHDKKTRCFLSLKTILDFINKPAALQTGFSRELLYVGNGHPKFKFSGSVFSNTQIPITLNGVPLIWFLPPEEEGAPFRINANLFDSEGNNTLKIINNEWRASSDIWDLTLEGGAMIVREGPGEINLSLKNTAPGLIEIERMVAKIGNKKIIGNQDKIELFDTVKDVRLLTLASVIMGDSKVGMAL